tara:strand:- start:556 stop:1218 length:663 start_codon:yes stop_codon:yes gene_type:complete
MFKYLSIIKKFFNHYFSFNENAYNYFFNLKVNINKINFFLELKNFKDKNSFIWDGDWDKQKIKITKYRKYNINYNSMFQIYKEKINFKKSDEYKFKLQQIKSGKNTARGKTINQLDDYFASLNNLKNSLKKRGYLSQSQLSSVRKNDEIGVVIGRNGEIIKIEDKFGGTHRFAICKIFKINHIIVNVKAIHKSLINTDELKKILVNKDKKKLEDKIKKKL